MDKNLLLDTLQKELQDHLKLVLENFTIQTHTVLQEPSSSGGWSIVQCLDHLNGYGHYYLPLIKKALAETAVYKEKTKVKHTWLGRYFIKTMRADARVRKYKAFKNHIPNSDLDAYAVMAEFVHQSEQLLMHMEQSKNVDCNHIKINISISRFVKLNLYDVFGFLIAHNERHLKQASRNLIR